MAKTGKTTVKGFHHVAMKVANFDQCLAFYRDVLGLKPVVSWGEADKRAVMLDMGDGGCIELFAGGKAGTTNDGPLLHVAMRTDDVDAAIERVRAAGMEITTEPKDVDIPSNPPTPVRIGFFRGPGGELMEFFKVRER